jgi:hypothetical protein
VNGTDENAVIVPCHLLLRRDGSARLSCRLDDIWRALGFEDLKVELGEAVAGGVTDLAQPAEPGPAGGD